MSQEESLPTVLARTILPFALAVAFGRVAVAVDLHNDEVQATLLVLLTAGFTLGAIWPARAWRWALVLGLSIPVGDHLLAQRPGPINWGTVVAVVPALIGTYIGLGVRRMIADPAGRRADHPGA